MEKIAFNDDISETLLINLYMRHLDFSRPDSLLHDEFSGRVVNEIDYDFAKFNASKMTAAGAVIRAKFFDERIVEFYQKYAGDGVNSALNSSEFDEMNSAGGAQNGVNLAPNTGVSSESNSTDGANLTSDAGNSENSAPNDAPVVIVQVGAGLDTRPLRLQNLCPRAVFYDLDLADVIALRDKLIPKHARNFSISSSMFETKWMDELATKHAGAHFCFVLEGVAMYFDFARISDFFNALNTRFSGQILLDVLNSSSLKMMNKKRHDSLKFIKNPLTFYAIDDPAKLERGGVKCLKNVRMFGLYYSYWPLLGKIVSLIPPFKNFSKFFAFEIGR